VVVPGPRGNIELGQAFADEADERQVDEALSTGDEFLAFCGVIGLGRLLAGGHRDEVVARLHGYAADPRWRVREGVAMALQRLGDTVRDRALARLEARSVDGVVSVVAAEFRSQLRNREAARTRLAVLVREAVAPPAPPRRPTRPSRAARQRRLDDKRRRSQTKRLRRPED